MIHTPIDPTTARIQPGMTAAEVADARRFKREIASRNPAVLAARAEADRQKAILAKLGCFDDDMALTAVTVSADRTQVWA